MTIDPTIERPVRTMLGHAISGQLDDLPARIQAESAETVQRVNGLCAFAAAYIAIDVTGMRWPTDRVLRKIANCASRSSVQLDVSEEEIREFLVRVALGQESVEDVFPAGRAGAVPIYATTTLLLTFAPEGMRWFEYLDQICDAAEISARISTTVLPALLLRVRKGIAD
jgi:hypothetical protein